MYFSHLIKLQRAASLKFFTDLIMLLLDTFC